MWMILAVVFVALAARASSAAIDALSGVPRSNDDLVWW
jgi:hypothetical protein